MEHLEIEKLLKEKFEKCDELAFSKLGVTGQKLFYYILNHRHANAHLSDKASTDFMVFWCLVKPPDSDKMMTFENLSGLVNTSMITKEWFDSLTFRFHYFSFKIAGIPASLEMINDGVWKFRYKLLNDENYTEIIDTHKKMVHILKFHLRIVV